MGHDRSIEVFRPVIYEDSIEEAVKTLRSGWIGAGPKVKQFEEKFSRFTGSRYCTSVNTGTSALHLALESLSLPKNSRILTSEISHIATVNSIYYSGHVPVFADVERTTGNISADSVEELMDDSIKAILCTHIGGYPCDMDALSEVAIKYGIPIVEDCSHAIGSTYKGKAIGSGTLCCFSFGFPKAITGVEGGAVLTSEPEYAEKITVLRNFGMGDGIKFTDGGKPRIIDGLGYRYNWNDVMASIALKQMDHFESDNARRRQIAENYMKELGGLDGVNVPEYDGDRTSAYFFIPLFFGRRDALAQKLLENGIGSKIYFRRYADNYNNVKNNFPNADWYSTRELTLPINAYLSDGDIDWIVSIVKEGW
jgi:dTDP-4-amino-4,6-dideoxygalactose transaminase